MVLGIIIDFLICFLVCFIIYRQINVAYRPRMKTILKAIGLGVLSIAITFVLSTFFIIMFNSIFDLFFSSIVAQNPMISFLDYVVRQVLVFVIFEEVAKYFLFDYLWNNGDLELKSPLQTALIFVIVGSTFSFIEDLMYILDGTSSFARILTLISGHLTYALIYSIFFTKEVIRVRAMYIMDDSLAIIKTSRNQNVFAKGQKYLLKGLLLCVGVHFLHNFMCLLFEKNHLIYIIVEILFLTCFFIHKIKHMILNDRLYDSLAYERIFYYYPELEQKK